MNLLIPYVHIYGHQDPLFDEFTYGDGGNRAKKLSEETAKGDYVFFHTSAGGKKYITAYYVKDRVLHAAEAVRDRNIRAKYRNPHILDYISGKERDRSDTVILFGDPITSKILERPLPFDRGLASSLSLGIGFSPGKTDTQCIGSATRAWRELTDKDVRVLLKEIRKFEKQGFSTEKILSTDEVSEILERDLERFIEDNPSMISKSLKLKARQLDTEVGRIDLLFEDKRGNPTIVELKLNKIGRSAIDQLRRYMKWAKKQTNKEVKGIIVCKGVMPAFEEEFGKLKDIKILCYGWKLKVYPWK